jgi:predicted nuclease of predicted toxin-antitoxin system
LKIVVDENVSYGLVEALRNASHDVMAVSEMPNVGLEDDKIFKIAVENQALLITRDYHFTNAIRFPAHRTGGIVYIRRGNLTGEEEIRLVESFLSQYETKDYSGKLVTLYKDSVRIR